MSLASRSVSFLFGDYIQLIFILLFLELLRTLFWVSDFHGLCLEGCGVVFLVIRWLTYLLPVDVRVVVVLLIGLRILPLVVLLVRSVLFLFSTSVVVGAVRS